MVSGVSSARPVCWPRFIMRSTSSSSGTSSPITACSSEPCFASSSFSASACAMVRGNPSNTTPSRSFRWRSSISSRIFIIRSSGMSWPFEMKLSASLPSSEPEAISWRSTSPVEIWYRLYSSISFALWVPLPLPGAPKITRLSITMNDFYILG